MPTVFVDCEGHVGRDNLVVADLAELEGAVCVDGLHLQNAVVLLPFDHRGLVGLLLEHRRVLVDVVHLDVHGGPGRSKIVATFKLKVTGEVKNLARRVEQQRLSTCGFSFVIL